MTSRVMVGGLQGLLRRTRASKPPPRRWTVRALLGPLVLCPALASFAHASIPSLPASLFEEYTLTSWTDDDGLFGGWIVGIAQDRDGFLWVGSVSGLLRFDGLNFERFRPAGDDVLPQRSIAVVFASSDGSVWVGFTGGGGISRILNRTVTNYGSAHGLGHARIAAITEDADGTIVAGTADGLFRLIRDRWVKTARSQGLDDGPVQALYRDRTGGLWVATSTAIFHRARSQETYVRVRNAPRMPFGFSEADGLLWTTDPEDGYAAYDRAGNAAGPPSPLRGAGYRLLHDRSGNLWLATLGRGLWLVRRDGRAPDVISTVNGLSNDTVRSLFEDRNGDIWAGTTLGLHRFSRRRVMPIDDLGVVRAVQADADSGVWVGTMDGLVHITEGGRVRYGIEHGLPNLDVRALHLDAQGQLWVATESGVVGVRDGRIAPVPLKQGRWPVGIVAISVEPKDVIWICTIDHGLFRWEAGELRSFPLPGDFTSVYSVFTDRPGRHWLALSGGGLAVLDQHGRFELVRESDQYHRSDLAAYEDQSGSIWFAAGQRLTRFKDGRLSAITGNRGMPPDAVRAIVGDSSGHLWLGTSGGILRFHPGTFDEVLNDPSQRFQFRAYNSSDGLAGVPVRNGFPNATRAKDGTLWFVTTNGLTVVDPERLSPTRPAPTVRIERVTASNRSYSPDRPIVLPPGANHLQVEYTAVEFFSPRHVEFRHRLEGFEERWIDAGSSRVASYTNLPPGQYEFRVIARSSEGIWNDYGDTVPLYLEPMFHQTTWFYAVCGLVALVGVVALWGLRLRQVRHQFALVLAERARMAREIHDTLLQSLAGLELQVSAVSSQLEPSQHGARRTLERVRRQIQFDVSEARQSIWGLRSPALDRRDLPSSLEEMCRMVADAGRVPFAFELIGAPGAASRKTEEHLLRVGREAVNNAVRHAGARRIRVDLEYAASSISLRVIDDGHGFDPAEIAHRQDGHWGIAAMHERAEAIGGRLTVVSAPGAGTTVEMRVPHNFTGS